MMDLGDLTENQQPLLIFGGSYSNLEATQALKKWADDNGFSPQQCICTGDIIAYCGNPVETTDLIYQWGVHCIQGNVEQSLADKSDDCGCGFESGTVCDILSKGWFAFADSAIQQAHRDWFKSIPDSLEFKYANRNIKIVHGAVSNVSRFMFESQPDRNFLQEFDLCNADIIISGHSGIPFTKKISNKIWHNSGALGMPANDGTPRVWFSIVSIDSENQINFSHHSLDYEFEITQQTMLQNQLNQGYDQAISSGLWPSMDVLPEIEKSKQGQALIF